MHNTFQFNTGFFQYFGPQVHNTNHDYIYTAMLCFFKWCLMWYHDMNEIANLFWWHKIHCLTACTCISNNLQNYSKYAVKYNSWINWNVLFPQLEPPAHLSSLSDYADVQPRHYDADYIADIGKQMRIPDRLHAVDGMLAGDRRSERSGMTNMIVPDRIMVAGMSVQIQQQSWNTEQWGDSTNICRIIFKLLHIALVYGMGGPFVFLRIA